VNADLDDGGLRVGVPADVEAPDTLVFGLTAQQAAILAVAAAAGYLGCCCCGFFEECPGVEAAVNECQHVLVSRGSRRRA
jgi:hypothetical protein